MAKVILNNRYSTDKPYKRWYSNGDPNQQAIASATVVGHFTTGLNESNGAITMYANSDDLSLIDGDLATTATYNGGTTYVLQGAGMGCMIGFSEPTAIDTIVMYEPDLPIDANPQTDGGLLLRIHTSDDGVNFTWVSTHARLSSGDKTGFSFNGDSVSVWEIPIGEIVLTKYVAISVNMEIRPWGAGWWQNYEPSEIQAIRKETDFGEEGHELLNTLNGDIYLRTGGEWIKSFDSAGASTEPPASYIDRTELITAEESVKGITVTVDSEPGNVYIRNVTNDKWIVPNNNKYPTNASFPDIGADFEGTDGTTIRDVNTALNYELNGIDWVADTSNVLVGYGDPSESSGIIESKYVDLNTSKAYTKLMVYPSYKCTNISFRFLDEIYNSSSVSVRSIEFYKNNQLITDKTGWTFSVTTEDVAHGGQWSFVFDSSLSLFGNRYDQGWISVGENYNIGNVTFPEELEFDTIKITNGHSEGSDYYRWQGVETTEVWIDNTAYSTVWADPTHGTLIFSGDIPIHGADSDIEDWFAIVEGVAGNLEWVLQATPSPDYVPTSYADRTELIAAVDSVKGITVTVDSEPGNTYTRNTTNDKWIPTSGNMYLEGDMPTDTDFELPAGLALINTSTTPGEWEIEDGL